MDLSYLWLLPVIVLFELFFIARSVDDENFWLSVLYWNLLAILIVFSAIGIIKFSEERAANAQIEVSASVPLTEENAYTTCLSECRFNYLK